MDEDRSRPPSLEDSRGSRLRAPQPRDEFEGVVIGGRYLLKRRIGEGGFGCVYEAVDERFDSPVAVKLLFGRTSESEVTFRKEAKLIRRFKHPHVVEVYDYGVDEGVAYIVMEYLNGSPLHKYFERHDRRLPVAAIRKFVTEVGSALENAHDKSLVHRDLKPQNVMVVDEGQPTERFVLLDLGMATKTDAARDETIGNPMANSGLTPQYAPPEQFRQQPATHLSDIYSFGTILYHLLSGRLPFPNTATLGQLWHAVEHDPPPPFAEVATERAIPESVEAVVRQCLEKKPENRPPSMRELRERFLKALDVPSPTATAGWSSETGPPFGVPTLLDPRSQETQDITALRSGGLGAPSATRPTTGTETLPLSGPLTQPGTQTRPGTLREAVAPMAGRPWLAMAGGGAVIAAAVVGLVMLSSGGGQPAAPPFALDVSASEWVVGTGRSQSFEFALTRQPRFDAPVSVEVRGLPAHVAPEVTWPQEDRGRVVLRAGPAAAPRDVSIRLAAVAGESEVEQPIELRLVWLPPEEFFAPGLPDGGKAAGIVQSRRTGWNFYERLDRVLPDGSRVPFVLVLDESNRDSPPRPFYVMRNKVWNGLFAAFADEQPEVLGERWRAPVAAGEPDADDPAWLRLPVMNVPAVDALSFAKWLGGERGHLPRREQWRTSAGFYEYDLGEARFRDAAWSEWQPGPHAGARVAVGEFGRGRRLPLVLADEAGEGPIDDRSPKYGIRDLAGNGQEFTSDLVPDGRLSLEAITEDDEPLVFVLGKSYTATMPLMYADLAAREENVMVESARLGSSVIGFRVVVEPE